MSILNMGAPIQKADKRVARFVIGTSTAGWKKEDVDYLCDGTNDESEINAAINALPANGGEIVILDGEYNLRNGVYVEKASVKIRGNGRATRLIHIGQSPMIYVRKDFFTIDSIMLDSTDEYNAYGVYIEGKKLPDESWYSPGYTAIVNCIFKDLSQASVRGLGSYSIVSGCVFVGNKIAYTGVDTSLARGCVITGNTFYNMRGPAIKIYGDSDGSIVEGNTCYGAKIGVESNGTDFLTITGNVFRDCDFGMDLSANDFNTIVGNTCIRGRGQPSDYTVSQHTMKLGVAYSVISSNNCMGKAPVVSGSNNTLVNNKHN